LHTYSSNASHTADAYATNQVTWTDWFVVVQPSKSNRSRQDGERSYNTSSLVAFLQDVAGDLSGGRQARMHRIIFMVAV
jgi:hypothetical protein